MDKVMTQAIKKLSEFTPDDWRVFISRLVENAPGKNSGVRLKWLQERTGISPSTMQNWLSERPEKQGLLPDTDKLFTIAALLDIDLATLIVTIQHQITPPPIKIASFDANVIKSIAQIQSEELQSIAKSLRGLSQGECYKAMSNLGLIAQYLS